METIKRFFPAIIDQPHLRLEGWIHAYCNNQLGNNEGETVRTLNY